MALAIPFIDAILENDLRGDVQPATYGASDLGAAASRDASHAIIGESNCPGHTCGSERLSWMELGRGLPQAAAAWMMEVLHTDAPLAGD